MIDLYSRQSFTLFCIASRIQISSEKDRYTIFFLLVVGQYLSSTLPRSYHRHANFPKKLSFDASLSYQRYMHTYELGRSHFSSVLPTRVAKISLSRNRASRRQDETRRSKSTRCLTSTILQNHATQMREKYVDV